MNYEVERKLNDKVDKWEFNSIQQENRQLKNDIRDLEEKFNQLKSVVDNRYYPLEELFNIIAEIPEFGHVQNRIYELRMNLQ